MRYAIAWAFHQRAPRLTSSTASNLRGNRGLAAHSVDRNGTTTPIQAFQQQRHCGNLIRRGIPSDVAKHQPIGGRLCTDEMQRRCTIRAVMRHTMSFAITGDERGVDLLDCMLPCYTEVVLAMSFARARGHATLFDIYPAIRTAAHRAHGTTDERKKCEIVGPIDLWIDDISKILA